MKVLLGTIACMIVCTITLILPASEAQIQYKTLTWDFSKVQQYGQLIGDLRKELRATTVCNIPSTSDPPKSPTFVLVRIINKRKVTFTVAFRKSNVYYVGYQDAVGGRLRANFVANELTDEERNQLFPSATIRSPDLPYGVSYRDLEKVAGVDRDKFRLGVENLSPLMDIVNGADYGKSRQDLAKFALMVIQMVAEATRFKYISEIVLKQGTREGMTFLPDATFLRLENNWGSVSDLIHNSSPRCNAVQSPSFPQWSDIKPHVGLLKFKTSRPSVEGIFDNNDDNDEVDNTLE